MSDAAPPGTLSTEQLFREHAAFVARFLTRMGVPSAHLEDALQEVFLVVHRNGGYRPGLAKPTSYLGSIAIHAARKSRRSQGIARTRYAETAVDELAAHGGDPNRALETQEDLNRLQAALDRLPDELRTPLVLADLEGESGLSIAAGLGLPLGTVYWRLHEARKKFRHTLKVIDSQAASTVVSPRSEPKRGSRAASLGMLMFTRGSSNNSEALRLLRLGREHASAQPAIERLLANHRQLVQSGAPLPPWAAACTPRAASWLALSGATTFPGLLVIATGVLGIVLMHGMPARHATMRPAPKVSEAMSTRTIAAAPQAVAQPRAATAAPTRSGAVGVATAYPAPDGAAADAAVSGTIILTPSAASRKAPNELAASAPRARTEPQRAQHSRVAPSATATDQSPTHARTTDATAHDASDDVREIQALAQAENWLATQPARALAAARAMTARFPHGYLHEERSYVEVIALFELGQVDEARTRAATFLHNYPDGPFSRRVRASVAASAPTTP